jgi:hypothetical protein
MERPGGGQANRRRRVANSDLAGIHLALRAIRRRPVIRVQVRRLQNLGTQQHHHQGGKYPAGSLLCQVRFHWRGNLRQLLDKCQNIYSDCPRG